jgi:hypothetical protein
MWRLYGRYQNINMLQMPRFHEKYVNIDYGSGIHVL